MTKKYLWRLQAIIMTALLSVGFASCCCDKTVDPETTTGDGLQGYWLEDMYKVKTETVNGGTPEASTQETLVFDDSKPVNFFYLDGQGGGTYYYMVCTEESRNVNEEYQEKYTSKVGTFADFQAKQLTFFGYKQEALLYFLRGTTLIIAVGDSSNSSINSGNGSNPLDDILSNPNATIGEIFGNTDPSVNVNDLVGGSGAIMKNYIDGGIYGYHRATKVQ